jgi:hypothetical protein
MSVLGLGDRAVVKVLECTQMSSAEQRVVVGETLTVAGAVKPLGFTRLAPSVNPIALTLVDGANVGDIVEILHDGGGNLGVLTPAHLHSSTSISFQGGGYCKLMWAGTEWYIIGRVGAGVAAGNAVAGYPVIA